MGCEKRGRQQILFFFLSDFSLLNETTQFNCPEFMGLTIGKDYMSGVLWGKEATWRSNIHGQLLLQVWELTAGKDRIPRAGNLGGAH